MIDADQSVRYIHSDHLGTPRLLTDASQKAVWAWQGEPFGADQANEDPESTGTKYSFNLRFPGQYYDVETGNHYNLNRDYDPRVGRYVQSDPIGLAGGINTYAYVGGNPLSWTDPSGLQVVMTPEGPLPLPVPPNQGTNGSGGFSVPPIGVSGGDPFFVPGKSQNSQSFCDLLKGGYNGAKLAVEWFVTLASEKERKANPTKGESEIWQDLDNAGNGRKKSGSGSKARYYEWDHTHNDIEVYDKGGKHLGSMNPSSGEMYKPPVPGRTIKL